MYHLIRSSLKGSVQQGDAVKKYKGKKTLNIQTENIHQDDMYN